MGYENEKEKKMSDIKQKNLDKSDLNRHFFYMYERVPENMLEYRSNRKHAGWTLKTHQKKAIAIEFQIQRRRNKKNNYVVNFSWICDKIILWRGLIYRAPFFSTSRAAVRCNCATK